MLRRDQYTTKAEHPTLPLGKYGVVKPQMKKVGGSALRQ